MFVMKNYFDILITGDYYGGGRTQKLAEEGNYESIYNDFLPIIKSSDFAITNLESPITDSSNKILKSGPALKSDYNSLKSLSFAGFNLVCLANNHLLDYGIDGYYDTIESLNKSGIRWVGAGNNCKEASKPFIINTGKNKVAILNIAENEFSTTNGENAGANGLNPILNYYSIIEAKRIADFVVVIVHGGHEMYQLPSPRIKSTYRFFIDIGVDCVVAHHPHCFSGYEIYNSKPIFYSLGNFIFDMEGIKDHNWNQGYAVLLSINNQSLKFKLVPYIQSDSKIGIRLMKTDERIAFDNKIDKLNNIISNDERLSTEFEKYCLKVGKRYNNYLEPHSNRILRWLQKRKIFPSLISFKKRKLILNLVRCESHRDILLNVLKNK